MDDEKGRGVGAQPAIEGAVGLRLHRCYLHRESRISPPTPLTARRRISSPEVSGHQIMDYCNKYDGVSLLQ